MYIDRTDQSGSGLFFVMLFEYFCYKSNPIEQTAIDLSPKLSLMAKRKRTTRKQVIKGSDLPRYEKIELARQVCDLYSSDRYTLAACLKSVGIKSDSTWYKWLKEIEEIEELYKEAQNQKSNIYRENLVERARTRLELFLDGWIQSVEEEEYIPGPSPESPAIIQKRKIKQIYVKPSMRAVEFTLVNLDGKNFTKNPEPYKAGNENIPSKITIVVEGSTSPIHSEDDIKQINIDKYL